MMCAGEDWGPPLKCDYCSFFKFRFCHEHRSSALPPNASSADYCTYQCLGCAAKAGTGAHPKLVPQALQAPLVLSLTNIECEVLKKLPIHLLDHDWNLFADQEEDGAGTWN